MSEGSGIGDVLNYINPLYWVAEAGKAAGHIGISDTSATLLARCIKEGISPGQLRQTLMGGFNSEAAPDGEQAVLGALGRLLDIGGEGLTATIGMGGGLGGMLSVSTPNPASVIMGFGISGGNVQSLHKVTIEALAEASAPGFRHKIVTINGRDVEIWMDASGIAEGESEPKIYINFNDGEESTLGARSDRMFYEANIAALGAQVDAMKSEAIGGMLDYLNGPADVNGATPAQSYMTKLFRALRDQAFDARPAEIHPYEPAPPPEDVRPSRPAGSPVPPAPPGIY